MPPAFKNNAVPAVSNLSPSIQAALTLLLQTHDDEHPDRPDSGQGAIAVSRLRSVVLSETELRWLLDLKLVENRNDGKVATARRGRKAPPTDSYPVDAAYFQLTRGGLLWARQVLGEENQTVSHPPHALRPGPKKRDEPSTPFWDADDRTLWWGNEILHQFHRRHAPNLELLLAAFQRQNWKPWIADPLAREKECKFNPRLHDAIKYLNKLLRGKPIRFHGSGDGRGVRWEAVRANNARFSSPVP
jgi:hypothetical protein